jgi:hypothetical protein
MSVADEAQGNGHPEPLVLAGPERPVRRGYHFAAGIDDLDPEHGFPVLVVHGRWALKSQPCCLPRCLKRARDGLG